MGIIWAHTGATGCIVLVYSINGVATCIASVDVLYLEIQLYVAPFDVYVLMLELN